jgi:hypothetical protein
VSGRSPSLRAGYAAKIYGHLLHAHIPAGVGDSSRNLLRLPPPENFFRVSCVAVLRMHKPRLVIPFSLFIAANFPRPERYFARLLIRCA